MADFSALKTAIQNAIKQNGNEEITGNLLQEVLLAIVTTLGDGSINDLVTALGSEATTRSQADATLQQNINAEAQARQLADSTLQGRINTAMQAINAINNAIANGCVYAGIATPSSTPASGKVFYLALTAGTYTNYGGLEVSQGINILKNNGSAWSLDVIASIDDAPTPSSNNLVKSGGVFNDIMTNGSAFDLSAYNNGTTYADLNAALTALNALPAAYKKGGMSFKYVQTSNNKYVQYRLMSDTFNTTEANWQGVDEEPVANSKNLVKSGGVWDSLTSINVPAFNKKTRISSCIQEMYVGVNVDIIVLRVYKDFGSSHKTGITFLSSTRDSVLVDISEDFQSSEEALAVYNKTYLYHKNGNYILANLSLCNVTESYYDDAETVRFAHATNDFKYAPYINNYLISTQSRENSLEISDIEYVIGMSNNPFTNNSANDVVPFFTTNETSETLSSVAIVRVYKNFTIDNYKITGFVLMPSGYGGSTNLKYCIMSKEELDLRDFVHFKIDGIDAIVNWDKITGNYIDFNTSLNSSVQSYKDGLFSKKVINGMFGAWTKNRGYIKDDGTIQEISNLSYTHKQYVGNAKYVRFYANAVGTNPVVVFYNDNDEMIFRLNKFENPSSAHGIFNGYVKIPNGTSYFRLTGIFMNYNQYVQVNFSKTTATLFSDNNINLTNKTLLMHEVYSSDYNSFDYTKTGTINSGDDGLTLAETSSWTSNRYFAVTNKTLRILCKFNSYGTYLIGTSQSKIPFIISNGAVSVDGVSENYNISLGDFYWISFKTNLNYDRNGEIKISCVNDGSSVTFTTRKELTDYPYVETNAGASMTIKQVDLVEKNNKPYIIFYGDSISALAQEWDWETLIENHVTEPCSRSGRASTTINEIAERMPIEAGSVLPKIVFIGIGTNGGNTYDGLARLVEYIRAIGATPYLNHVPCGSTPSESNIQIGINAIIDQVREDYDVKGIDFDKATSISHDGLVVDPVCFPEYEGDYHLNLAGYMLHPGSIGCKRMLQQAFIDTPELFNS